MRSVVLLFIISSVLISCTKNNINEDTSGEVYEKYAGDYLASGTEIRYRTGIDTITAVDSFRMEIAKFRNDTLASDSVFYESRLTITNFLGSGRTVQANASYFNIVPLFTSTVLPEYKQIKVNSETKAVMNYSYYRINGFADTSWFSGKATKIK
jgi:hypothetical protein